MMIRSKRVRGVTAQKLKSCSIDSKTGFKESKGPMTVILGKNLQPVERLAMPIQRFLDGGNRRRNIGQPGLEPDS